MNKEITFNSAVITTSKNGNIRIFINPSHAKPKEEVILNDGVIEFDDDGNPTAIYAYKVLWGSIPLPTINGQHKPIRYTEEESNKICKRSLSKTEYEKLRFTKKFPFVKKVVETYWIPNGLSIRYKVMDDFRLVFVYNCNVSIYEGEITR
jgi:hypothetical protein